MAMNSSGFSFQSDRRSSLRRAAARAWLLGLLGVALVGCDSVLDDDDDTMQVRAVNLVQDSPGLQFKLEDTVLGGGTTTIAFPGVGGYNAAPPGPHTINLQAPAPNALTNNDTDDDPIAVGSGVQQSFDKDVDYTIVAYGKMDSPQVFVLSGT